MDTRTKNPGSGERDVAPAEVWTPLAGSYRDSGGDVVLVALVEQFGASKKSMNVQSKCKRGSHWCIGMWASMDKTGRLTSPC